MNDKKHYCKKCLTMLDYIGYCDACGHRFNDKESINAVSEGDFPRAYFWYGLLAGLLVGFISYFIIYSFFGGNYEMKKMGVALFFIVPMSCGATIGYFLRPKQNFIDRVGITIFVAITLAGLIYTTKMSGLACASVLVGLFVAPLYCGLIFGRFFRLWAAQHLTAKLQSSPLVIFFLMPILYGAIEEQYFQQTPTRTVETQVVIEAPQAVVWNAIRFYEHVRQDPPLILKLGLPIPKQAIGNHKNVGDITSCEYEGGGFIRKKITRLIKQEELSFDVIEQSIHFEHDLTLHGGSILLSPINTGKHTMITMKTNYESYVRPSWLWETSMDYVIKTLHRYVIQDMQNDLRDPELKIAEKT
jgi:hypothetical protein